MMLDNKFEIELLNALSNKKLTIKDFVSLTADGYVDKETADKVLTTLLNGVII